MKKQEIRIKLRQKRKNIPEEERKRASAKICEWVEESEAFRSATTVLFYVPSTFEVNLLPLMKRCREEGKTVAVPRTNPETFEMTFCKYAEKDPLSPGAFGIPEPLETAEPITPDEDTLCLVPGLSFDPYGTRLGNGKGCYDRFLADFPGKTVGVCFAALVEEELLKDANDVPMQSIVTENGPAQPKTPEELTKLQKVWKVVCKTAKSVWAFCKKAFLKLISVNPELPEAPKKPALLCLSVFALLGLFCFLEPVILTRKNENWIVLLMMALCFLAPTAVYWRVWNRDLPRRMRIRLFRPAHLWFAFCILMLAVSGGLLGGIAFGGMNLLTKNFTLYGRFVSHAGGGVLNAILCALVYGLLPALCEEIFFRGALLSEYEPFGVGTAVAVTSVLFALLQGSFALFLPNLLIGVLLALSLYTSRSLAVPVLIHFLYNLFCLFIQPYLSAFYTSAGSPELFVFLAVAVFLLFAAFAAGEGRKIFHIYAKKNLDSSYAPEIPWRNVPGVTVRTVLVWPYAVCLGISLAVAIWNAV